MPRTSFSEAKPGTSIPIKHWLDTEEKSYHKPLLAFHTVPLITTSAIRFNGSTLSYFRVGRCLPPSLDYIPQSTPPQGPLTPLRPQPGRGVDLIDHRSALVPCTRPVPPLTSPRCQLPSRRDGFPHDRPSAEAVPIGLQPRTRPTAGGGDG